MSTFREMIYMTLDMLKVSSDDSFFTEEHIAFMLSKCRAMLLTQAAKEKGHVLGDSNSQTLCLDLEEVSAIPGEDCEGGSYLRSTKELPNILVGTPRVHTLDYFTGNLQYINRERFRYAGASKWLRNIIYTTIGPDNYLYLKSYNPQFLYLEKVRITGIFEDIQKASELACDSECDPWDNPFPLEEGLAPALFEMLKQMLAPSVPAPEDKSNNADDDLAQPTVPNQYGAARGNTE